LRKKKKVAVIAIFIASLVKDTINPFITTPKEKEVLSMKSSGKGFLYPAPN